MEEGNNSQRELRPFTAEMVDLLRQLVGRKQADETIRKAMKGQGGFWVRETCPDGVVREFGSRDPVGCDEAIPAALPALPAHSPACRAGA